MSSNSPQRYAWLGGHFNPFHNGHLAMAQWAHHALAIPITLIPTAAPPHKDHATLPVAHRLALLEEVCKAYPFLTLSTLEFDLPSPSYTYRTAQALKEAYPKAQLYFLLGEDSLQTLPTWEGFEILKNTVNFIVFARHPRLQNKHTPSDLGPLFHADWDAFLTAPQGAFYWVEPFEQPCSSTAIRENYHRHRSALPDSVYHYLCQHFPEHYPS